MTVPPVPVTWPARDDAEKKARRPFVGLRGIFPILVLVFVVYQLAANGALSRISFAAVGWFLFVFVAALALVLFGMRALYLKRIATAQRRYPGSLVLAVGSSMELPSEVTLIQKAFGVQQRKLTTSSVLVAVFDASAFRLVRKNGVVLDVPSEKLLSITRGWATVGARAYSSVLLSIDTPEGLLSLGITNIGLGLNPFKYPSDEQLLTVANQIAAAARK
ncbi:hypothetical protein ASF30_11725 [Leifsonia sp. Leaf264]|nr:hypothetical protein ASF30_11725 [Leifsonia sp. Leaf264]